MRPRIKYLFEFSSNYKTIRSHLITLLWVEWIECKRDSVLKHWGCPFNWFFRQGQGDSRMCGFDSKLICCPQELETAVCPSVAVRVPQQREKKWASPGLVSCSNTHLSYQAGEGLLGDSPSFVDLKANSSVPLRYNPLPPTPRKGVKALFLSFGLCFHDSNIWKRFNTY